MATNPDMGRVVDHKHSSPIAVREHTKPLDSEKHLEHIDLVQGAPVYDDAEHEPELHIRTWVALVAMCLFNYVVVFALLSPPAVVSVSQSGFRYGDADLCRSHTSEQASVPPVSKHGS